MQLEVVAEIPSTSTALLARARAGNFEEAALLALRQTQGHGSHGRHWLGAEGNLALSLLLRCQTPLALAGQWSLLAGLATLEALATPGLQLKWPNDILRNGAKLAGILVESQAGQGGSADFLVIGIGVNLAFAPTLPDRATASLDGALSPIPTARAIIARIEAWRAISAQHGFAPIREAWLAHAHPTGTPLTITTPSGPVRGTFAGLTESGALRLETASGPSCFITGEVLPPA